MHFKFPITKREGLIVLFTAILANIITTIQLFAQWFMRPPHHVFVGLIHYWEDFYYYLDQFYQGAHGGWLIKNNFTIEPLPPTPLYTMNVLLGKIGSIFGFEPFITYNLSAILLKILFMLVSYCAFYAIFPKRALYRYVAFLFFLFSTSLPLFQFGQGRVFVYTVQIFRTGNLMSARFGNIPDSLIRNILFVLLFLLFTKLLSSTIQKWNDTSHHPKWSLKEVHTQLATLLIMLPILTLLTLSDAVKSVVLLASVVLVILYNCPKRFTASYLRVWLVIILFVSIPQIILILILRHSVLADPVYTNANLWDITENIKQIAYFAKNPWYILVSFGTLGIAASIGVLATIRKKRPLTEQLGLAILVIGVSGYFLPLHYIVPVPEFRFIFSATYIFFAMMAVYGIVAITKLVGRQFFLVLLALYFIPNMITMGQAVYEETLPLKEPYYHFAYIPEKLFEGFIFLRTQKPDDAIVLASSATSTDMMIPGLTGKRTYSGHFLTTLNENIKNNLATGFLYTWKDQDQAREFLVSNNIRYVVWTSYSGDVSVIKANYPFLRTIFENEAVSIFTY